MTDQEILDEKLYLEACKGNLQNVIEGLNNGADINYRREGGRSALMAAAYNGHKNVVEYLLKEGANRNYIDHFSDSAEDDARKEGYEELANYIRDYQHIEIENSEEIIFTHNLSDRMLEEVFNFKLMERISLVRKKNKGPVEAVTRESFSSLEEKSLRAAFNEHVKRGGKVPECEVFQNRLGKSKKQFRGLKK